MTDERVAALQSATSTLDEALLDAPLPLPAEVWIEGAPQQATAVAAMPNSRQFVAKKNGKDPAVLGVVTGAGRRIIGG